MSTPDPFGAPGPRDGATGIEAKIKRDQWGRYLLPNPETGEPIGSQPGWTRATTVAESISDTFALNKWRARMVAKGVASTPRLHALAAATPLEDKDTLNKLADDALEAAGGRDRATLGTALHSFKQRIDQGEPLDIVPLQWREDIAAYRAKLAEDQLEILPQYVERVGVNIKHHIAGTFDNLVRPLDAVKLTMADLKTGAELDYAEMSIEIQLAIYAGFDYLYDVNTGEYEKMPEVDQDTGLVFHLPVGEHKCQIRTVNLATGRANLELAMAVRQARKARNRFGYYSPPANLATIERQLLAAPTRQHLADIYARWVDAFTPELVEIGRLRYAELEP